jgi:hypothetical protein
MAAIGLGLIVCTASGCRSWSNWGAWKNDDGFAEEDLKLSENLRPREPNSKTWFTSTKGQQIDRNFGIGDE